MKKVAKIKGIVSRPLQIRYLEASEAERASLRRAIEEESHWMIDKMRRKGYRLEATVADVFGVFTRGAAAGTVRVCSAELEEAKAS
jgi:hypothetical protein